MAKKNRLKRITGLNVSMVSLLRKGANQQPGLLKSEDGGVTLTCLSKGDGLRGLLYSIVYKPNTPDSDLHYMEPADVEQACHTHMANGSPLDMYHDGKVLAKEQATVVESFILSGHDPRFPDRDRHGALVKHEGCWGMVTKINDEGLLSLVKSGDLTEVSLFAEPGAYRLVDGPSLEKDEDTNQPKPMDQETIKALVTGLAEALKPSFESIAKAQKDTTEALTKSADTQPAPVEPEKTHDENGLPLFKGDWKSRTEVQAWQRDCQDAVLAKQMASLDPIKDASKLEAALLKQEELTEQRAEADAAFADKMLGSQAATFGLENLGGTPLGKAEDSLTESLDAARKSAEAYSKRMTPGA